MTLLEEIKQSYFADFGMVVSTPWGIVNNRLLTTGEYQEAKNLISKNELKLIGKADPDNYSNSKWLSRFGDLYGA